MIREAQENSGDEPSLARIPFDSAVWQMRDEGDFIHTKIGEVRDEDGFLTAAEDPDAEASAEDWDAPQGAGGWDDNAGSSGTYSSSGGTLDDGGSGGGSHGFDDGAQVRPSRSSSSSSSDGNDASDARPSKLLPKKKRK